MTEPATSDSVPISEADARDLAGELTDRLIDKIDGVRTMTTDRALKLVKYLVYGMVIVFAGILLALIALIFLFRFTNAYLPPADGSWSAWLLFGIVFTLIGAFIWRKRGRLVPKPAA